MYTSSDSPASGQEIQAIIRRNRMLTVNEMIARKRKFVLVTATIGFVAGGAALYAIGYKILGMIVSFIPSSLSLLLLASLIFRRNNK